MFILCKPTDSVLHTGKDGRRKETRKGGGLRRKD